MEESCLDRFLSLILYKIQDHTPKAVTAHSDLGRTMSLTNQDAPGQHDGDIFSAEISLSYMTLGYANLTKPNQHEQYVRYQKNIWTYGHMESGWYVEDSASTAYGMKMYELKEE